MSNHLPRPKVASSSSATEDSTACCSAGEIILERSEVTCLDPVQTSDHATGGSTRQSVVGVVGLEVISPAVTLLSITQPSRCPALR